MTTSRCIRTLAVLTPFFLLVGCGGESAVENAMEQQIEEETGEEANVVIDDTSMRVETEEGTVEIGSASLPENWPEDVAVYPNAAVSYSAAVNSENGEPQMAFVITTDDSVTAVAAFYKDQLMANGWTMEAAMEAGTMTILSGSKDDRIVSLVINGSEEQTSVTLTISND